MTSTHILVDFENTQPTAADVRLVQRGDVRLTIFRGPGQKKYDAEFTEALLPMGERVAVVRCEKSGRNAVDMHIAFELGRLVATAAGRKLPQLVVVSRDTDYEPLLQYLRAQGCTARRAISIKAALGGSAVEAEAPAAPPARKAKPPVKKAAVKPPAKVSAKAPKDAAGKARTKPAVKAPKAVEVPPPVTAAAAALDKAMKKFLDGLQVRAKNRPTTRKAFEKAMTSALHGKLPAADVPARVDELVGSGILRIDGKRLEYPRWA